MTINPETGMPELPDTHVWHMNEFDNVNNNFLAGTLVLCEKVNGGLHGEVEYRIFVHPGEDTTELIREAAKAIYDEWLILPGKAAAMRKMLADRNDRYAGSYPPNSLTD